MSEAESATVPNFTFLSAGMKGGATLAAYHESTREIFPCQLWPGQSAEDFAVEMTGWHLGLFLLATIRATPLMFHRSAAVVAESGLDGVIFQLYTEGGFSGSAGRHPVTVQPGDICLFDLRQVVRTRASAFHTHSMMIPRKLFDAALGDAATLHGLVLPASSPMTQLLAAHLVNLVQRVPALTPRQALAAAHGTIALILAVLRGMLPACGTAEPVIIASTFRAIADHIDAHLGDRDLTPESLMAGFGLSRAALYRLFAEAGGVASYIRRRRLSAAALALISPESRQCRVGQIARRFGFDQEAAFSRSFRSQFGITPGEVRSRADCHWQMSAGPLPEPVPGRAFRAWSKSLR